jgi:hypothetical protein
LSRQPQGFVTKEFPPDLQLRSLAELYRAQALYLLRQQNPDPEQALLLLGRAVQADPAAVGQEPLTFWLQALARETGYQRQAQEAASRPANAPERQVVCARLEGIREKLVDDYTRVVALSADPKDRALHEEASAALKKLLNAPRPCAEPPPVNPEERAAPPPAPTPQQRARKVRPEAPKVRTIFIHSKTVYLKPNQLEAALLKRPEFQTGEWRIIRNQKEADYVVELSLPFLTWNWTYEVTQQATTALVGAGKVREATAGAAVPRLVAELLAVFKRLRAEEAASKGRA